MRIDIGGENMKRQGFTLVELLAVIVIIGIIALITSPVIMSMVAEAKKNAAIESFKTYKTAIEDIMIEELDDETFPEADENGCYLLSEINTRTETKGNKPSDISADTKVCLDNGKVTQIDQITMKGYSMAYKEEQGGILVDGKEVD